MYYRIDLLNREQKKLINEYAKQNENSFGLSHISLKGLFFAKIVTLNNISTIKVACKGKDESDEKREKKIKFILQNNKIIKFEEC